MALSDQILLVYVLGNYKKKSQPYIDPCGNSNIVDDLTRLYEIKALTISPNSSLDAFQMIISCILTTQVRYDTISM